VSQVSTDDATGHPDDPEDADPGLARQRTRLAWIRTTIAFAALGGAVLKTNIPAGIAVLAMTPLVIITGHMSGRSLSGRARPGHLLLTAVAITAVAVGVLILVLLGHGRSPGFHPPAHVQGG
jgi:uncharacterized membrane protein YidH (DUF202 family)